MNYLLRFETALGMPSQTIGNVHVPQDPDKDDDHRILYAKKCKMLSGNSVAVLNLYLQFNGITYYLSGQTFQLQVQQR